MIAVLNNLRAQAKKPALGFLNPWLYKMRNCAFTEYVLLKFDNASWWLTANSINMGKSGGCLGISVVGEPSPKIHGAGWYAADGWDPITGIGTPIFDKLRRAACR